MARPQREQKEEGQQMEGRLRLHETANCKTLDNQSIDNQSIEEIVQKVDRWYGSFFGIVITAASRSKVAK